MSDTIGSRPKRDRAARASAGDGAAVALRFRTANENVREAAPLARKMRWRRAKLVVAGSALIVGGWYFGVAPVEFARFETATGAWTDTPGSVVAAIATFIVASATPFVPGAEIGFALIAVFGAPIAVLVYVSMVAALTLSFLVGRLVPAGHVAALFGYLGLDRASGLSYAWRRSGRRPASIFLPGTCPTDWCRYSCATAIWLWWCSSTFPATRQSAAAGASPSPPD